MQTPNPKGYPQGLWPDDIETPSAWELAHWSFDRVADAIQRAKNASVNRKRSWAKRENVRKGFLATL
jgi:hypothetical protein